jgi:hypothetical protein
LKQRENEERTRTTDRYQPNAQLSDEERDRTTDPNQPNSQSSDEEKRKIADYLSSLSRINQKDLKAEQTVLLDLAMDWNCIDVAREFIFQNSLANILVLDILFYFYYILFVFLASRSCFYKGFTKKFTHVCL